MDEQRELDMQAMHFPSVTIYADGSYKPMLKVGGYGTIMVSGPNTQFLYGGSYDTSNNVMELTAVLAALRTLTCPCRVLVVTDSKYVADGISRWMGGWAANGWIKRDGKPISNLALWQEMYAHAQVHLIHTQWVKGHSGDSANQTCDHLAAIGAYNTAHIPVPSYLLDETRL